jgi:hypothetical protein
MEIQNMDSQDKINTSYRLTHAAAVKVAGQSDVNAWNIPTEQNNLSDEILEVLSQNVDRAHDAVRKGHEIESEYYDEWCADAEYGADEVTYDGKGHLYSVHRLAHWREGFDPEKYARRQRKIEMDARRQFPEQVDSAGRLRAAHATHAVKAWLSEKADLAADICERLDEWCEENGREAPVDNGVPSFLDGLSF